MCSDAAIFTSVRFSEFVPQDPRLFKRRAHSFAKSKANTSKSDRGKDAPLLALDLPLQLSLLFQRSAASTRSKPSSRLHFFRLHDCDHRLLTPRHDGLERQQRLELGRRDRRARRVTICATSAADCDRWIRIVDDHARLRRDPVLLVPVPGVPRLRRPRRAVYGTRDAFGRVFCCQRWRCASNACQVPQLRGRYAQCAAFPRRLPPVQGAHYRAHVDVVASRALTRACSVSGCCRGRDRALGASLRRVRQRCVSACA